MKSQFKLRLESRQIDKTDVNANKSKLTLLHNNFDITIDNRQLELHIA